MSWGPFKEGRVHSSPPQGPLPVAPPPSLQGKPACGSWMLQGPGTGGQSRWVGTEHSEPEESRAPPSTFDPPLGKNGRLWAPPLTDDGPDGDAARRTCCFPWRKMCAGYYGPRLSHPPPHPPPLYPRPSPPPSSLSPEILGREARGQPEWEAGPGLSVCTGVCPQTRPKS